jgi:hypothetical protein
MPTYADVYSRRGLAKNLFSSSDTRAPDAAASNKNLFFVLEEALVESGLKSDPFARRLSLHYALDHGRVCVWEGGGERERQRGSRARERAGEREREGGREGEREGERKRGRDGVEKEEEREREKERERASEKKRGRS